MDEIYVNDDYKFSKPPGHGRGRDSSDWSDHTGQPVSKTDRPSSTEILLKIVLAALCVLLLGALAALCILGILYHNKGVSYKALSEQYISSVERLSVQERNASAVIKELESQLDQANYENKLKHESMKALQSECQKCGLCGKGWKGFGGKCYYFSTDELNWIMSRDDCAGKGGHLVVIISRAEQNFVSSSITENHWIGLNDQETEGKWMWVDKQPLNETIVTFWYQRENGQDEPDNWRTVDPSGENCASLGDPNGNTDKWFDASCGYLKKYICEKENTSALMIPV